VELLQKIGPGHQIRPESDIRLIDAGPGYSDRTVSIWKQADLMLLAATSAREVVLATYAAIKLAKANYVAAPIWLLPNQCFDAHEAEILHRRISESCERFLGCAIPVAPWLPNWDPKRESSETPTTMAELARFCRDQISPPRSWELGHGAA
jgi:MinD-like ATPase involved in chromosome partitioning or flagellar assembly